MAAPTKPALVSNPNDDPSRPLKIAGYVPSDLTGSVEADSRVGVTFRLSRDLTQFEDDIVAGDPILFNGSAIPFESFTATLRVDEVKVGDLEEVIKAINSSLRNIEADAKKREVACVANIAEARKALDGIDFETN